MLGLRANARVLMLRLCSSRKASSTTPSGIGNTTSCSSTPTHQTSNRRDQGETVKMSQHPNFSTPVATPFIAIHGTRERPFNARWLASYRNDTLVNAVTPRIPVPRQAESGDGSLKPEQVSTSRKTDFHKSMPRCRVCRDSRAY